ncbi:ANK_REP_REGION domain-containing protein, partial [Haematococcus lacustris]
MGQTALHIAALWGNLEAAAALLRLGTPANIRNTRGSTPLHFAASAKRNCKEMCELLLQHGAHTDPVDMAGRVPYEMAASDDLRALLGGPDP